MARRTQEQWRQLIEEQQASGLSASTFCRERQINAKYFSLRKQKLKQSSAPAFIQAKVAPSTSSKSCLYYKGVELLFNDCFLVWIAQLLRELCA